MDGKKDGIVDGDSKKVEVKEVGVRKWLGTESYRPQFSFYLT